MPELPYGAMPIPGTPISELRRWQLEIWCSRCQRHVVLELATLVQRYDQSTRVGEVIRKLRCQGVLDGNLCRAKPSRVNLAEVHVYGKSMRKIREVTVVGG